MVPKFCWLDFPFALSLYNINGVPVSVWDSKIANQSSCALITLRAFPSLSYFSYNLSNSTPWHSDNPGASFGQKSDFEGNIFHPKQNYKVYGTSIDYLIETNISKVPNFIKIDVDGLEHKILMGGTALLKNTKLRSLLVEINEGYKEQFDNIIEIMKTNNFVIKEKVKTDIANEKKFQNLYNYIFVRNDLI